VSLQKKKVKTKNKIVVVKHRMRGPGDLVIKGQSAAWQHFIKIYDRHPELEGSKVVYAVCCHCHGVLKAGTDRGGFGPRATRATALGVA
jgi:hypothetical protein